MGLTPFFHDDHLTVYQGDCREVMAAMEPESVHCVVTSPPYWGLRDYGTATWVGGDEGCDHRRESRPVHSGGRAGNAYGTPPGGRKSWGTTYAEECRKCGAIRHDQSLGLEPTPEAFVANMVAVFREVRRVLRKDGTLWLNLGDSYGAGSGPTGDKSTLRGNGHVGGGPKAKDRPTVRPATIKPKDLVGIPWRVAFALQADGWYLRSDIIWAKPNPMPESVTDRPTKAHEYLFLLTKSARYYYDADAVREDGSPTTHSWKTAEAGAKNESFGNQRDGTFRAYNPGRNLRSVWNIATEPYPGAHFATFPRKLVEPCVKAGTSERGVCPECGAPWMRDVERGELVRDDGSAVKLVEPIKRDASLSAWSRPGGKVETVVPNSHRETVMLGWRPSCAHDAEPVAGTVLDPFGGSGTTGMVAQSLGRRAVLIDLNGDYLVQAMARNAQTPLGLVG